jgi:mitotic-spindle organizing protein 1
MSQILNCGLDQRTLTILAGLIENGVNPEALAAVVKELKRETEALKVSQRLPQSSLKCTLMCLGRNRTTMNLKTE